MKQLVCMLCALGCVMSALSQLPALEITCTKTTSLVFPFAIQHVDRGSKEVLVQQVPAAGNILLLKAANSDFPETNLSVITGEGKVYSFIVRYASHPSCQVYTIPAESSAPISVYARSILDNPPVLRGINQRKWDLVASVTGIYIKENTLFYQLRLTNHSGINYDIAFLRFYVAEKRRARRTALQERELVPLYTTGNTTKVKASSQSVMVFAFEKFTIPGAKNLVIDIGEKNGGRQLKVKLTNRNILHAIPLPTIK